MIANVLQASSSGLPNMFRTAREAIDLPEVQEMLRRLSEHNLGIFIPHAHSELTGEFLALPDDAVQVESDLRVSFQSAEEIASQTDRFAPVGWSWRAGGPAPVAVCEMVWEEGRGDSERVAKHKMIKAIR